MTRIAGTAILSIFAAQITALVVAQDVSERFERSLYYIQPTFHPGHMTDAAEAQVRLQQARSLALDNDLKRVNIFFDRREENLSRRATLRKIRRAIARDRSLERKAAESSRQVSVRKPAPDGFSPVHGIMQWPLPLRSEEYFHQRTILERLFEERTPSNSGQGSESSLEVATAVHRMKTRLAKQIREMSPSEYIPAKRFLEALATEARNPLRHNENLAVVN